jgi:hypothetical protein
MPHHLNKCAIASMTTFNWLFVQRYSESKLCVSLGVLQVVEMYKAQGLGKSSDAKDDVDDY